jgi:putative SOS response-associated peptidase YedK
MGDVEGEIHSCTILTTDANDHIGEVPNRMPVILPHKDYELWLDPDVRESEELLPLLAPHSDTDMQAYPVSRRVNRASSNGPGCIESAT